MVRQRQAPSIVTGDRATMEPLSRGARTEKRLVTREFLSAISQLAPTQRQAILLADLEGRPYHEIADQTGISPRTVAIRVARARDSLERLLLEGTLQLGRPSDDSVMCHMDHLAPHRTMPESTADRARASEKVAEKPFDIWLRRQTHALFDDVAMAPIPEKLRDVLRHGM